MAAGTYHCYYLDQFRTRGLKISEKSLKKRFKERLERL